MKKQFQQIGNTRKLLDGSGDRVSYIAAGDAKIFSVRHTKDGTVVSATRAQFPTVELDDFMCDCAGKGWYEISAGPNHTLAIVKCHICDKYETDEAARVAAGKG